MYTEKLVARENYSDEDGNEYKWNGRNAFKNFILTNDAYKERLESLVNGTFKVDQLSEQEIAEIESDEVEISKAVGSYNPVTGKEKEIQPKEIAKAKATNKKKSNKIRKTGKSS